MSGLSVSNRSEAYVADKFEQFSRVELESLKGRGISNIQPWDTKRFPNIMKRFQEIAANAGFENAKLFVANSEAVVCTAYRGNRFIVPHEFVSKLSEAEILAALSVTIASQQAWENSVERNNLSPRNAPPPEVMVQYGRIAGASAATLAAVGYYVYHRKDHEKKSRREFLSRLGKIGVATLGAAYIGSEGGAEVGQRISNYLEMEATKPSPEEDRAIMQAASHIYGDTNAFVRAISSAEVKINEINMNIQGKTSPIM